MAIPLGPRAAVINVVAPIDQVRQIAGVGALGLGSDFDGNGCRPVGLDERKLTRAPLEKGSTVEAFERSIAKICNVGRER